VFNVMVIPVLMYGSGCRTQKSKTSILFADISWSTRLLGLSRLQHIRTGGIRKATVMEETLIDTIKAKRLSWFGHVSTMDNTRLRYLALHMKVEGLRNDDRPRVRWRDGVHEDIKQQGMEFTETMSVTEAERDGGSSFVPVVATSQTDGTDDDDDEQVVNEPLCGSWCPIGL